MAVTLQRVLSDDELHKRVRAAVGSGRKVYERVGSDRNIGRIATQFGRDKNAQKVLRTFLDDLVAASGRLKEKPKKRHRRNVILVSGAASAGTALAAASRRLTEKPKKRHRLRNVILVSSALGAGTAVVIRRQRSRDNRIVATKQGYVPADFPTQAPAHAGTSG
jgi:hypothetical protein